MRTVGAYFLLALAASAQTLPPPGFHHLHLNSVDPEKAIDFYTRQFPSTEKSTFAGAPSELKQRTSTAPPLHPASVQ